MIPRVYGYTAMFSAIFTKRNNSHDLLFAALDHKTMPKWGLLFMERHSS